MRIIYLLVIICLINACRSTPKEDYLENDSKYYIGNGQSDLSAEKNKKIGEWVKIGVECYGIQVVKQKGGGAIGQPVKCKVLSINNNGVKCEVLADAPIFENLGCNKIGLRKGETWWETDGELFKTRELALKELKEKGWYFEL